MVLKESDLVNMYLWDKHRNDLQWRRVRLGVVPTHEMSRMHSVLLRWADAIVINDGQVLIIEAKLRPNPSAFGQLDLYAKLFRVTPEFSAYASWPIRKQFLTTFPDLALGELASDKGVDYIIYPPLVTSEAE